MTRKTYRTAQGKTVDLGVLMLQNENTRAVGNMNVNARGDLIDGWNRPIDRRTQQVQKQYDRQVTNVKDEPVTAAANASTPMATAVKPKALKQSASAKIVSPAPVESIDLPAKPTGLAAAIARAREIRQDPIETSQQNVKPQRGITRI